MIRAICILALLAACSSDDRRGSDSGPRPDATGVDVPGVDAPGTDVGIDTGSSGGAGIGDPCSVDADCTDPPDATCFTEIRNPLDGSLIANYPGGFCSKGCEGSEDCGSGDNATCVTQSMSGGGGGVSSMTCTISCSGDADCRQSEGYRCQTLLGFGFCSPP